MTGLQHTKDASSVLEEVRRQVGYFRRREAALRGARCPNKAAVARRMHNTLCDWANHLEGWEVDGVPRP